MSGDWQQMGKNAEVLDPLAKSKANPKSRALAIRAKCWQCSNFQRKEVTLCPVTDCALWPFRPWQGGSSRNAGGKARGSLPDGES